MTRKNRGRSRDHVQKLDKLDKLKQSSNHSLSSFCSVNGLENSMSYIEKSAKKLLPILKLVKTKMVPDKKQI